MEALTTTQVGALFSEGELQTLRRLLARLDAPSTTAPTSTSAASTACDFFASVHASVFSASSSRPWIIDSGATDHMTGCSSFFDSYSTCSGTGNRKDDWYW